MSAQRDDDDAVGIVIELLGTIASELRRLNAHFERVGPEEPLLDCAAFAALLGVNERTFRRLCAQPGVIPPPIMIGSRKRWRREDAIACLERLRKKRR